MNTTKPHFNHPCFRPEGLRQDSGMGQNGGDYQFRGVWCSLCRFFFSRFTLVLVLALAAPARAQDTTYTWAGNSSGNWNAGGNWASGQVAVSGTNTALLFTGTNNLQGGTLEVGAITSGSGTATFDFNGGTLQASGASTNFMANNITAYVQAGGALINTDYNITIANGLLHDPALGGLFWKMRKGSDRAHANRSRSSPFSPF